jgi:uncharacterized protein YicC (UPF0701 family)
MLPNNITANKSNRGESKMTENTATQNGTTAEREAANPALQVVDRAVGAVPLVADAVRSAVGQLGKTEEPEAQTLQQRLAAELDRAEVRGADVRRQVTDQVVEQARKARERVEPAVRKVRERI